MATVTFLYRSKKEESYLGLRLLYRYNNIDFVFGAKTKFMVSELYWNKQHKQKQPKDIEIKNKQVEVNEELNNIENYILTVFRKKDPLAISKEWLQLQMDNYYKADKLVVDFQTNEVVKYIDVYIDDKRSEIKEGTIKTCNVIKELVKRYEITSGKKLLISDVDLSFRLDFENYCLNEQYSPNTITRAIRFVKTICLHARSKRIETSYQLDSIKATFKKVDNIYLSFEEISAIEDLENLPDYLENARDLLIISCYTGQRVSDFMRFKKSMINTKTNRDGIIKTYIDFTQVKTGKEMTIPLHQKVLNILNKREGEFPRQISDQKFNKYIKIICRLAGLTMLIKGSKKIETAKGNKIYRNETGLFEKCELVSSHIGRRSFATNFYDKIPTALLMSATGHTTEKMFLNYIGKGKKDLAEALAEHF